LLNALGSYAQRKRLQHEDSLEDLVEEDRAGDLLVFSLIATKVIVIAILLWAAWHIATEAGYL